MEWLLGGAAVWLLFNAMGARRGQPTGPTGPGGPGTTGGGISTTTAVQAGVGVLGAGAGVTAPILAHAVGGGAATTTGGTSAAATGGTSASGGGGGASTTAQAVDLTDAFATTVDTSIAGAVSAAAFMVSAALAFVGLGLALQSEANQETLAGLREVARSMFNRYTRRIYGGESSQMDSMLAAVLPQLNQNPPPYPNLNPGSGGGSRQLIGHSVLPSGLQQQAMPSPSTPYGFTRCDVVNDLPTGCVSSDPAVAAYAQVVDSYFTNSIDPRLPSALLMQTRAFYRWLNWTVNAQMNSCLANFYPYKDHYRGQGEDSSAYWLSPGDFDGYASQFFQGLPTVMQPPVAVSWNDYPSLLSQATGYIAMYNKAHPSSPVSFVPFMNGIRFVGTASAAAEACYIGMGANDRQWTANWPGDAQFTALMMDSLGLTAAGWTPGYWLAPNVGPNPILLGYDPSSGCLFDFINAHNNPNQGIVYQFPLGATVANAHMVVPLDSATLFNLPTVAVTQRVSGGLGGYAGVRRPFAGFANIRARGLKGLGRYAAVAPGWRHR